MPPYSGAHFQVLLRAPLANAPVETTTVTAREWESYVVPDYPYHKILGRIRNLDVELFVNDPDLEAELLSLDYTVRPFDRNKRMSIYADTEFKDRTLLQKLQDQLYEVLRDDGVDVAYGLVTETQSDWVLITKLDRERYNPQNPCPPILTTHETEYNTIGYILDNDVFLTADEKTVKRFYLNRHPWVSYKIIDKTVATEYSLYLEEEKDEKRTQHQREKRRAKKKAIQRAKGTEIERQGALEAGGKDKRVGGKSYKKCEDVDVDAGAGAAEEQAEVGLEKLVIGQVKQQTTQRVATGNDKQVVKEEAKKKEEMQRDEEAKKEKIQRTEEVKKKAVWDMPWKKDSAVDEIRKPNCFFSGEDVLKEG